MTETWCTSEEWEKPWGTGTPHIKLSWKTRRNAWKLFMKFVRLLLVNRIMSVPILQHWVLQMKYFWSPSMTDDIFNWWISKNNQKAKRDNQLTRQLNRKLSCSAPFLWLARKLRWSFWPNFWVSVALPCLYSVYYSTKLASAIGNIQSLLFMAETSYPLHNLRGGDLAPTTGIPRLGTVYPCGIVNVFSITMWFMSAT